MATANKMFALVAAFCVVGVSLATSPPLKHTHECDGFGNDCSIELKDGLKQKVTFKLSEPIICPASAQECVVVVTISNSHPNWVAVNPCAIRWTSSDWHQPKSVTVSAVQDYVHENEDRKVHLEVNLTSESELYKNNDPKDIYVESRKQGTAQCRATGDPHYTTFDGKYWHFYDGNRRNPTRITLYRSTSRDFVVQNQVRGNPAVACALAGREGDDRVMINNCGGGVKVVADIKTKDVADQPVIETSGSTYTVYFKSGAWMRAQVTGWGMNVYAQSVDPGNSCGMCGNFNGNPNDDTNGYQIRDYNSLTECQKVDSSADCKVTIDDGASCDIWKYTPKDDDNTSDEDLPDPVKVCKYEPPYLKPVIGSQDSEDLTDFLKQKEEDEKNRNKHVWDDETGTFVEVEPYDLAESKKACEAAIDASDMVKKCKARYDMTATITEEIGDCTEDFSEFGGPDTDLGKRELVLVVTTIEQVCIEKFIASGDKDCEEQACLDLLNVLCPEECSGNGKCEDAACQCDDGYAGKACNILRSTPPKVDTISESLCDTATSQCPEFVEAEGSGFYCYDDECNEADASVKPKCRFYSVTKENPLTIDTEDYTETDAEFLGEKLMACKVPRGHGHGLSSHHNGDQLQKTVLRVSSDGKVFSEDNLEFVFYDSTCIECNDDLECKGNDKTCQITTGEGEDEETKCYEAGHPDPTVLQAYGRTNPCRECIPAKSTSEFSFKLEGEACKPQFTKRVYDWPIQGSAPKGKIIGHVDGYANPFVNIAPNYKITYEFINTDETNLAPQFFEVMNNGSIRTKQEIDLDVLCQGQTHCAADPTKFNGFFKVKGCDNSLDTNVEQCTEVSVVIELVKDNGENIFKHGNTYSTSVMEHADVGTVLDVTPPLTDGVPDGVKYGFFNDPLNLDGAFAINQETGEITVANSEKLNYEASDIAFCARHRDSEEECKLLSGVCEWDASAQGASNCLMKHITLTIKGTDENDGVHLADINLRIFDAEEKPTHVYLEPAAVPENSPAGTLVGLLTCRDPEFWDEPTTDCTFTLSGDNKDDFEVRQEDQDGKTKSYLYTKGGALDFEADDKHSITVSISATDVAGLEMETPEEVTIDIIDVNEAPENIQLIIDGAPLVGKLQLAEDTPTNQPIATVTATDPDAGNIQIDCQLATSGDGTFVIESNILKLAKKLDFETNPNFDISIGCVDEPGPDATDKVKKASSPASFGVKVIDANDAPELVKFEQTTVPDELEGDDKDITLGELTTMDADLGATAFDLEPVDASTFDLDNIQCQLKNSKQTCTADVVLKRGLSAADSECASPDSEGIVKCTASFLLTDASNPALTTEAQITVHVKDVAEPPSKVIMGFSSISKDTVEGDKIGDVTIVDNDGEDGSYDVTLVVPGAPNALVVQAARRQARTTVGGSFSIVAGSNVKAITDKAAGTTQDITIQIQDNGKTVSFTESVSIIAGDPTTPAPVTGVIITNPDPADVSILFKQETFVTNELTLSKDVSSVSIMRVVDSSTCPQTQVKVEAEGNNYKEVATGGKLVCMESVIAFTATVSGSKVTLKAASDLAPKYTSSEVVYLKVPEGGLDRFLQVTLNYDGACAVNTCTTVCTPCQISGSSTDETTVDCSDKSDQIKGQGFMCDSEALGELVESCESCQSQCSDVCQDAEDELDDAVDKLNDEKDECTDNSCKAEVLVDIIGTLRDQEDVLDELIDECDKDANCETTDLDSEKDKVAGELDAAKQELEDTVDDSINQCDAGNCEELEELTDNLKGAQGDCDQDDCELLKTLESRGDQTLKDNSDKTGGSSDNTTIIIVVVVLLLLIILIAAVLLVMRNKQAERRNTMTKRYEEENVHAVNNQAFSTGEAQPFTPGVSNPLYDWYRPEMSRQDCTTYLEGLGEGAFVVRDSQATPGWHMLCVKTQNQVVHDKIRLTDEGMYELLPTMPDGVDVAQPKFKELPELIDYYVEQRTGMPYVLALANPIYDNHNLQANRDGYQAMAVNDPNAPSLAPKAPVDALSNPMYGAQDMSGTGMYAQAPAAEGDYAYGNPNDGSGQYGSAVDGGAYGGAAGAKGYLDISPDSTT